MRKLALIILDGWGLGEKKPNNAVHIAKTPFFDHLWSRYPKTQLQASGEFVGLPTGQIGGSEVGHLTIGAGRVLFQELPRITKSLQLKDKDSGVTSLKNFEKLIALATKKRLHLIGQISPGGIHSHQEHLFMLLEIFKLSKTLPPYIHFISDGRDTPPTSGLNVAKGLLKKIKELNFGTVVTLSGRFFAMDRDKNWDRTEKALNLYRKAVGVTQYDMQKDWHTNLPTAFQNSYDKNITDEFIEPVLIDPQFKGIQDGDPIFFFNFRSDRMKQIIAKITQSLPKAKVYTLTRYDKDYTFPVLFEKERVTQTIGEILSSLNLTQLRATETEKFPHVTYFFNGGFDVTFKGEDRKLIQSNRVKHDQLPEMQAEQITQNTKAQVEKDKPDFILVNFANPDMVGHTGNFPAVVKALEKVDRELQDLCKFLTSKQYICCITADHGNADIMYDLETLQPHTAHTLNPVPFIVYDPVDTANQRLKLNQRLENGLHMIAGTVVKLMGVKDSKNYFEEILLP